MKKLAIALSLIVGYVVVSSLFAYVLVLKRALTGQIRHDEEPSS